jgi:ring-1,2-phenylacetyl-CoA epoxidase subunit PaaD
MVISSPTDDDIWNWLRDVPDPEIPVLSVVDLGIVREVRVSGSIPVVTVFITPTYSGCPATEVIAQDIRQALHRHGVDRVHLETRLAPAWTTEWMSEAGREKLRLYGIAPPARQAAGCQAPDESPATLACPRCGSQSTRLISRHGSTPCKALHVCNHCQEPFDAFKCH